MANTLNPTALSGVSVRSAILAELTEPTTKLAAFVQALRKSIQDSQQFWTSKIFGFNYVTSDSPTPDACL